MKLRDVFLVNPLGREINPVIKVGDLSPAELRVEIEDYVVTDVLERYLVNFLEHYAETRSKETDKIGVWISGYVGSGKSHFAKLLGLLVSNPSIEGRSAVDRFRPRLAGCRAAREIEGLLHQTANFMATEVIPFQINTVAVKGEADDVCSIVYRQFFAHRGLSTHFETAVNIEEPLLDAGRYDAFERVVEEKCGKAWRDVRERPQLYWDEIFEAMSRAFPEKWGAGNRAKEDYDRSREVRRRTFEQLARDLVAYVEGLERRDRSRMHRLVLIVDELGQFVADSGEKLLDVQSLAEELGVRGKGRVWLAVTSHEAMHDIVKSARNFKGDLKKLEGRFDTRFTLTTENIERVLEERLLKKSADGERELRRRYQAVGGALADLGSLAKADRGLPACDEEKFIACYPFVPYYLILIPDVLRNLRTAQSRGEALSGATRTLLGITHGVLRDRRLGYGDAEVGRLSTLDEIFLELEDQEIPPETRREIGGVDDRIQDQAFPLARLLRALLLIQHVGYVPRTLDNLARLVATRLDEDLPGLKEKVARGLDQLIGAQYVAKAGDQYEYLSGERKRIEEEIADEEVRTAHKRDALKAFLTADVLEVGPVRFEDAYRFDVRVTADDQAVVSRGGLEVRMQSPLKTRLDGTTVDGVEGESVASPNTVHWIARPSAEIERHLDRYVRLDRVVKRYEADTGTSTEMKKLVAEKRRELDETVKVEIEKEIRLGFRNGHIVFRGHAHAVDSRIDRLSRIFTAEVCAVIPKVYTQFWKAKIQIQDERAAIEEILTAPPRKLRGVVRELELFDGEGGLNRASPALDDIYAYLDGASRRGDRVTGKDLREYYEAIPYGWDPNVPRVVVAALFRSGAASFSLDKKDFLDPRNEDARRVMMDSRRFDRIEIALEADLELSVEERMKGREMVQRLFEARPDETPAALAQAIRQQLEERVRAIRETTEWVRLTSFPAPAACKGATERLAAVQQETRPNRCVRAFLGGIHETATVFGGDERLKGFYPPLPGPDVDLAATVRAVDALHGFFSDHRRGEFERLRAILPQLEPLARDGAAPEGVTTLLAEYRALERDGRVLERWGHIHGLLLGALGDLKDAYEKAHAGAAAAFSSARERIVRMLEHRRVSLDDPRVKSILGPFEGRSCPKVENWSPETGFRCGRCRAELAALLVAPALAREREDETARRIEDELVPGSAPVTPPDEPAAGPVSPPIPPQPRPLPPPRPVARVDLREVLPSRRIRTTEEWDAARDRLDQAVRTALTEGKEVDLA
jgi:hypothetical protein